MAQNQMEFELAWNIADACQGFGMDFGGSVIKVFYMHNEDWVEPAQRKTETVRFRGVCFPRADVEGCLQFLKNHAQLRRASQDDRSLVYSCGLGGSQFADEIRSTLDVQTENLHELKCLFHGLRFCIENMKISELAPPLDLEYIKTVAVAVRKEVEMIQIFAKDNPRFKMTSLIADDVTFPMETPLDSNQRLGDVKDLYPLLLVHIGSNGGAFLLESNGKFRAVNEMTRVGRLLLGLGSLLTKSKSWDEFVELSSRGNMRPVHVYLSDFQNIDTKEDNFYAKLMEKKDDIEEPGFLFGKCDGKTLDDFNREDIATSFLYVVLHDLAHLVTNTVRCCSTEGIKVNHVLFSGGITSHPNAKRLISRFCMQREIRSLLMGEKQQCRLHFLEQAQYIGAIGALLNHKLQYVPKKSTSST